MQYDKFTTVDVRIENAIAWIAEPGMFIDMALKRLAVDVLSDLTS